MRKKNGIDKISPYETCIVIFVDYRAKLLNKILKKHDFKYPNPFQIISSYLYLAGIIFSIFY